MSSNNRRPANHQPSRSGGVDITDSQVTARDIAGRDIIHRVSNFFFGDTTQQRALRNRQAMLELVRNTWVKGVLERSLHGAAMIELGMEERAEAVERPWDMVVQMPDKPDRELPPGTKIIDVFDEMNGSLLILGEPGSGKTTTLLELARDTIARAEGDPTQPIPVVFNLSSWAEKRGPLVEWLAEELNTKYNIPKKVAKPWVEKDELLLLLDGLDEVKAEHCNACVEAINDFRQKHLVPLAVCSRIADYEALTTKFKLQGAVLLQQLTPVQIDKYLEGVGTELAAVRETLQHDKALQEMARSPLMLSIMTLAYQGMSAHALQSLDTTEARRKHLFDAYVRQMFKRRAAAKRYLQEQTIYWLAWLAEKMSRQAQTVFLIERLQPGWLPRREQRVLYTAIVGLVIGLMPGLLFGLLFNPIVGLVLGLLVGLVFWVGGGQIGGLFGGQVSKSIDIIEPTEILKWSRGRSKRRLTLGVTLGVGAGLVVGVAVSLAFDVVKGGTLGFFSGLIIGIVAWLLQSLRPAEIEMRTTPNQGIRHSIRNAVTMGLLFALSEGLLFGVLLASLFERNLGWGFGLRLGLSVGLGFGLLGGLDYGGRAAIQHFALRFLLSSSNHLPWNLVRFLDYATDRVFLRKVGGGYIFVHRLLMEHFAAMGEEYPG